MIITNYPYYTQAESSNNNRRDLYWFVCTKFAYQGVPRWQLMMKDVAESLNTLKERHSEYTVSLDEEAGDLKRMES